MKPIFALLGPWALVSALCLMTAVANAAENKSNGGWLDAFKVMAEVAVSETDHENARERLEAAVTARQFYQAMAAAVRLDERDSAANGTAAFSIFSGVTELFTQSSKLAVTLATCDKLKKRSRLCRASRNTT